MDPILRRHKILQHEEEYFVIIQTFSSKKPSLFSELYYQEKNHGKQRAEILIRISQVLRGQEEDRGHTSSCHCSLLGFLGSKFATH